MTDKNLDRILDNERDWRKHIIKRLDGIDEKQNSLINFKYYMMGIATFFGAVGHKLGKILGL